MRKLLIKIGVCIERMEKQKRHATLNTILQELQEGDQYPDLTTEMLLDQLREANHSGLVVTMTMMNELIKTCVKHGAKRTGYPHLCGETYPCGKYDDWGIYLEKARDAHTAGSTSHVSVGYSKQKGDFLISLVHDFQTGKVSAKKLIAASDRDATKMLLGIKGMGDWCAGNVLTQFLFRADVMLYGDVAVRNRLNDLYDINHKGAKSETELQSEADFPDDRENRNLIDELSKKNGWYPYRSIVCQLMWHIDEANLVLL